MSIARLVYRLSAAAIAALSLNTAAQAADFLFDTDPFAGSTALTTPGRQIVGNEQFIPVFNVATDRLVFKPSIFGISSNISFFNGLAANLPNGGTNFVVLGDADGDGDPSNGILLNAGLAANLIANTVNTPGSGFFIYFNSGLDLPRLVFSTDLSAPTADLKVLARFTGLGGNAGRGEVARISAANVGAVPEPASWALMIAGFGMVGGTLRGRRKVELSA